MKIIPIDIVNHQTLTWSRRPPKFDRGFTGHEHLYDFGLINMNGRIFDPLMHVDPSGDNGDLYYGEFEVTD